jgi:hypothetical protein
MSRRRMMPGPLYLATIVAGHVLCMALLVWLSF